MCLQPLGGRRLETRVICGGVILRPVSGKAAPISKNTLERAFIQKMKTKWGSSNPRLHHIRLDLELAKKPPACLDYVVLHEMLHFLVPDHSERFAALLDHHFPQWRTVRQALNEAPLAHAEWAH